MELKGQNGQPFVVDNILNKKLGGFFIEAGAHDGESISNSLFFELSRNWTGLLVEPNPLTFCKLLTKNRKAYAIQVSVWKIATANNGPNASFWPIAIFDSDRPK